MRRTLGEQTHGLDLTGMNIIADHCEVAYANDQMFIELAAVGKADFLVTGDKDLLVLAAEFGGRIVTVDVFLGGFGAG